MIFLNFLDLQKTAINLIVEEKYDKVISELKNAKARFPTKQDRIAHWLAGVYCLQNEGEKALVELNEVLDNGLYWNPEILSCDEELFLIHNTKEFATIIERCLKLYNLDKQFSKSSMKNLGNVNSENFITALHWKNSNANDFSEQIATEEQQKKYLFSFVQSSQVFSNLCYHWDNYEVAKNDILNENRMFEENFDSSVKNRIIFGASQGGETAIKMCFEQNSKFNNVIAVVPTLTDLNMIEIMLKLNKKSNIKITIITGDKDPFYENTLSAVTMFKKYNISCELIVVKGMGHTLPADFETLLSKTIENI